MKIFVITRFSYLAPNYLNKWANNSIEELKKKVFNKNRLKKRFSAFKKITYPSIINQSYNNWMWFIITSKFLPEEYKNKLKSLINNNSKIKVIFSENIPQKQGSGFHNYKNYIIESENYATVRLDDDDGINHNLFKHLQQYDKKTLTDKFISFPLGQKFTIKNDKIILGSKHNEKKIALGLTRINNYVYRGEHNKIHDSRIIFDYLPDSYYLFCDSSTYTNRRFF